MDKILQAAKLKTVKVWVSPANKEKFEKGETVISSIWGKESGLVELVIRGSQCFSLYSNGRPYIRKEDWTWEDMDNFKG